MSPPRSFLAGLVLALLPVAAHAATELQLWHSLDGANGALVARMADDFNASQSAYRVITIYKGPYAETINGGIAAYRAGEAPHILQVFEVGNGTMAAAIGAVKPVSEVLRAAGRAVEPDAFLPVIATNYLARDGHMLSLPFNISAMVMWINLDRFRRAGLDPDRLPETWPQLFDAARALKRTDPSACAFSTAWPTWAHIEQLSVWHDRPIATRSNGLDGFDAELVFNAPFQVRHLQNIVDLHRDGAFEYTGRTNRGEARFIAGECAIFLTSSSMYGSIAARGRFHWAMRPMPYYPDQAGAPQNAILGGGSLYVMQGKTEHEYAGVAEFLAFVLSFPQQALLYRNSGYMPVTRAAYEDARGAGFYERNPMLQIAVRSITNKEPTRNSAGLRLGNMLQIRDLWSEEIEAALDGSKTPQRALDDAVARGNAVLRLFQRRTAR
ncbi:sn-glycerol-3-phosphate ABC transporter substrate-binding protein UgpB [Methylobacterium planeticum]|uniref:sn-glycerol-3-phosphate-binding periplasmic protein UgpB n=1 Tax=Methylobacterium planeticum TaxID=2615211 RepID=A0A6N6MIS5_9HYPH|nr:sn-glycerol-3-phosphate ABC transporter substrate-binding protein UgpB [Methylobacterium planeticum]KAB1069890.1 sn-glycerol-3-phosphate ABC transporter substrate-binding protein UgpB [Methylobacterium planeticum]